MDIMYAVLPHGKNMPITNLHGLHYQQYQIVKTKFIGDVSEGTVFAALIDNTNGYFANVDVIQNPIIAKKLTRRCTKAFKDCASENAKRKHFRKQNNLVLTEKNWKQFVGKRNTVLANYQTLLLDR
ncbi:hypothetical protein [Photobacterium leiognathi]|uniref:hypothetical protein n=1 Tax=Photobacterium leiognathi TaxID=553611 RepID=UPI0027398B21|nr:hypothetical protein [Photobacterium leiognathi]